MPKTLIKQFPKKKRKPSKDGSAILNISEMFCDTIQGEGINTGVPVTFIRLQGCTLACTWCDTLDVWKAGNPYSVKETLDLLEESEMIQKFKDGQHIVFTGGSPLKQQDALAEFCTMFTKRFGFIPHYEVENECVLRVGIDFGKFISTWNNSPKLSNSGMKESIRIKPDCITQQLKFKNSWFKFVVTEGLDWDEIKKDFMSLGIPKEKIILMPEGASQDELKKNYEVVIKIAVREGVRFSDRGHITIWNKKTGV